MDLPPDISQKIADAARAVNICKHTLERAKTWEEKRQAQHALDAAEQAMMNVSMLVNRGLERAHP